MATGTAITSDLFIKGIFRNKYEVEVMIEEKQELIEMEKLELAMLIANTSVDLLKDKFEDNIITAINIYIRETFEWLQDEMIELYKLRELLDNFDERISDV